MPVMETTTAQELIELEEQFGAHNYHPLDVVIHRIALQLMIIEPTGRGKNDHTNKPNRRSKKYSPCP